MKYLEAMIALQPRFVIPAHGPVGEAKDLQTMVDYLLLARQRVRGMMERGLSLEAIRKEFHMNEFKDWDRTAHLPAMSAALHRELKGEGPEVAPPPVEKQFRGRVTKVEEEGRYLTLLSDAGREIDLRVSGSDIEGIPDRSHFRTGMRLSVLYEEQKEWNTALEIEVER